MAHKTLSQSCSVTNFWIVGSEMPSVQSAAGVNVPLSVWRLFRVLVTSWVLRVAVYDDL